MISKKIWFSGLTVPAMVFFQQSAEYQKRRRHEKENEIERRTVLLSQAPLDITPKNNANFPWAGKDIDKFDKEWSMKPVTVAGVFDNEKEIQVIQERHGEKGVAIVTPFYTHLDKDSNPQAILINRGWIPEDLKGHRMHFNSQ